MLPTCLSLAILLFAGPALAAPGGVEDAFENLKKAEANRDAAEVKRLAAEMHALDRQEMSAPAPSDDQDKEAWSNRMTYLKEIESRIEYALYVTAIQSPPAVTVDLIATLEQQNPKSKYLDAAYGSYLLALSQTGASAKIEPIAEKAIVNFPDNEDLLLLLANQEVSRQQNDRALAHATRLTTVLNKHPKPEGLTAAQWERKRSTALGRGYWIAGVIHCEKSVYANADRELRAALPLIQDNTAMTGAALFYLGVANFNLGKMTLNKQRVLEGAQFSEKAAAIEGPYSQQAWRNSMLMKTEAGKMR